MKDDQLETYKNLESAIKRITALEKRKPEQERLKIEYAIDETDINASDKE